MPVAADQRALLAQQVERRLVLVLVELVGVLDAEFRLVEHQVVGGIGDVDRAVIGLDAALVGLAVGQVHFLEDDIPALGRFLEDGGVVHQDVRTPLVRDAVVDLVDREPGGVLQPVVDRLPALDEIGVDRLHALAGDEAQRGITRSRDEVEAAFVHQRDHLVRRVGGLDVDLAARLLLEGRHPVVVLVGLTALDIARPGDDVDLALALAEFLDLGDRLTGEGQRNRQRRA